MTRGDRRRNEKMRLSCCWPAVLASAVKPLESTTWLCCLAVTVDRAQGDPALLGGLGREGFITAVRGELPRFGAQRVCHKVAERFFAALTDGHGVVSQRRGALERVGLLRQDWCSALARLATVEARMVGVLDGLGLTSLVTSIPGLSAVGAAVILAETGDLCRFASARSVVKHAGLNPAENTSANFRGRTRVSHRGRPALRAAAWRAAWGALPHNLVLGEKFTQLTTREHDRLAPGQARVACAAALLRWLYAVVTTRVPWNPDIAAGAVGRRGRSVTAA